MPKTQTRTYSWAELADHYRQANKQNSRLPNGSQIKKLKRDWRGPRAKSFYGARVPEVLDRLNHGFDFPEGSGEQYPIALEGSGPAWTWNDDDGDYEHEAYLSGEADYYLDRRIEPNKPGISVHAEIDFAGAVKAEVVADYGHFLGTAVRALQSRGYDCALSVVAYGRDQYQGEATGTVTETIITLTRFGEQIIDRDYAAIFAPGGYRHLIFGAFTIAELREGKTCAWGLGTAMTDHDWGVEWDEDSRTLTFGCNPLAKNFPGESMVAMLRETIEERF